MTICYNFFYLKLYVFINKNMMDVSRRKNSFEEIKQTTKSDSDETDMLALPEGHFKCEKKNHDLMNMLTFKSDC